MYINPLDHSVVVVVEHAVTRHRFELGQSLHEQSLLLFLVIAQMSRSGSSDPLQEKWDA